jgi:hypothetical protein
MTGFVNGHSNNSWPPLAGCRLKGDVDGLPLTTAVSSSLVHQTWMQNHYSRCMNEIALLHAIDKETHTIQWLTFLR